jgi:hypothetical protein
MSTTLTASDTELVTTLVAAYNALDSDIEAILLDKARWSGIASTDQSWAEVRELQGRRTVLAMRVVQTVRWMF